MEGRERGSFEAVKGERGIQVALSLKSAARHDTPRPPSSVKLALNQDRDDTGIL